ncbi:hypothetical protein SAMN05443144_1092 [Fodinibius roseus]|uniref:Uncharacterized protein n=1 Tax=Fodinibius roseus TaxID=1194090 RepID=A0A1M5BVG4_9BACT|nr:hypothetical protein [Fodinibius roseus]SHF46534.1 hypothetical protein SAMN05443144_1092 [Fodinibius roseus]
MRVFFIIIILISSATHFKYLNAQSLVNDYRSEVEYQASEIGKVTDRSELEDIYHQVGSLVDNIEDSLDDEKDTIMEPSLEEVLSKAELIENFIFALKEDGFKHTKNDAIDYVNNFNTISRNKIGGNSKCLEIERWEVGPNLYLISVINDKDNYTIRFSSEFREDKSWGEMKAGVGPDQSIVIRKYFDRSCKLP